MLDSLTTLAHSMVQSKGVYALLLGSGVSRSAGIPTGWEVTLNLIREVAAAQGDDAGADPEAWLKAKYGQAADYSALLDQLAKTPTQRQALMRKYIEPDAQEREDGLKQPTKAHRAIADLVRRGYIRVIVTTNFDRLLEIALRDVGVEPTVISTDDAVKGALPLVHTPCTILKVHGDYLDTRIKNTSPELAAYGPELNAILDRVFDEYGLIVSGWSGTWDPALVAAMHRCPSRRFPMYWAARGTPTAEAQVLIAARGAYVLAAAGADELFTELEAKVSALEEFARPHPLSAALAVAMVKRYIVNDADRIRLHDLLEDAIEDAQARIPAADLSGDAYTYSALVARVATYEAAMSIVLPLVAVGARWARADDSTRWSLLPARLQRTYETDASGGASALALRRYPALLAWYAVGIGAVAGEHYDLMQQMLHATGHRNGQEFRLGDLLSPYRVLDGDGQKHLPMQQGKLTGLSNHLAATLEQVLPRDVALPSFKENFDRFEALRSMVDLDAKVRGALPLPKDLTVSLSPGRFLWDRDELHRMIAQLERDPAARWLAAGPFTSERGLELLRFLVAYGELCHPF